LRSQLILTALLCANAAQSQIVDATYQDPTTRYAHGVLGDQIEHATLEVTLANGQTMSATWPDTLVFEDTSPRVIDLDDDGSPEVITVESHEQRGARLAVWGLSEAGTLGRLASTPFIGTRFRWLAPIGAADLDGDGQFEIAYIDRPHSAKTLRVWRYELVDGTQTLTSVGDFAGVTNHRIGERDIAGGIRDCGFGPEMIVASLDWSRLMSVQFDGEFSSQEIGRDTSRAAFAEALSC